MFEFDGGQWKRELNLQKKVKSWNKLLVLLWICTYLFLYIFFYLHINEVIDPWSIYCTLFLLGFKKSFRVMVDHCNVLDRFWSMLLLLWRFVVSQFAEIFIRQYQFLSTGDTNKYSEASRNRVSSSSPWLLSFVLKNPKFHF